MSLARELFLHSRVKFNENSPKELGHQVTPFLEAPLIMGGSRAGLEGASVTVWGWPWPDPRWITFLSGLSFQ